MLPTAILVNIVFSTLNRKLMPLIRYRTGDFGRFLAHSCKCENKGKRLDYIQGRIDLIFESTISPYKLDKIIFSSSETIDYNLDGKKLLIAHFPSDKNFRSNILKQIQLFDDKLDVELRETTEWTSFYKKKRIKVF